jgi:hypothetical protein
MYIYMYIYLHIQAEGVLKGASNVQEIADREADIYEGGPCPPSSPVERESARICEVTFYVFM